MIVNNTNNKHNNSSNYQTTTTTNNNNNNDATKGLPRGDSCRRELRRKEMSPLPKSRLWMKDVVP